jgi:hypothetical protein
MILNRGRNGQRRTLRNTSKEQRGCNYRRCSGKRRGRPERKDVADGLFSGKGLSSGASEFEELREVAFVCRSESTQVFVSGFTRSSEFFAAPGKFGAPTFHGNDVRNEARVSSIAVRKGMDHDQFIMKADGALVHIVCLVFQPIRGIAEKLTPQGHK